MLVSPDLVAAVAGSMVMGDFITRCPCRSCISTARRSTAKVEKRLAGKGTTATKLVYSPCVWDFFRGFRR